MGGVQVTNSRRYQLQGADHLILVMEWCADHVPDSMPDQLVLHGRPLWVCLEVFHDDGPPLNECPLVEGPRELSGRVVGGVREDARLLVAGGVVEDEHPVTFHGGETQSQLRPPEEC